jgi:hypothetical protein
MDWLKSLAPLLGTALAGPLGGAAASFLADKLGIESKTIEAVTEVLTSGRMTPEQVAGIKLAEIDFQKFLEANKIKVQELDGADRASAREREAKTGDTLTPRVLAFAVTLGFFGVLAWLLVVGKPTSGGDALLVMLGALGSAWGAIVSYYYGSSSGSRAKTDMLAGGAGR